MRYKNFEWYKNHPEVIARRGGERWTDLQIEVLKLCYESKVSLEEMTRMLGRTEYGVLSQLHKQKLIYFDNVKMVYYKRGKGYNLYDGRSHR